MTTEEESVEQAAAARRERLKALRAAQELLNTPDDDSVQNGDKEDAGNADEEENLSMRFRNYLPHDKQLQEGKLAPPVLPKFEDPVATEPSAPEETKDPFVNIAPKKPNWDLKRDVLKKLEKLERRTQKAIAQLVAEQQKENETMAEENEGTATEV